MSRLKAEIGQNKPFASLEEEAYLNLLRTASVLGEGVHEALRGCGLSQPQYNVLRILRGAGSEGLSGKVIGERMISRVPDVPRLLERLEREGLICRERSDKDRRVVLATITEKGLRALSDLDEPVPAALLARMDHMSQQDLAELIRLLELARDGASAGSDGDGANPDSDHR